MFKLAEAIDRAVAESMPDTTLSETVVTIAGIAANLIKKAENPQVAFMGFMNVVSRMLDNLAGAEDEAGN